MHLKRFIKPGQKWPALIWGPYGKNILPHSEDDFVEVDKSVTEVIKEISGIGNNHGLGILDSRNVTEVLESHEEQLTDDDLLNYLNKLCVHNHWEDDVDKKH